MCSSFPLLLGLAIFSFCRCISRSEVHTIDGFQGKGKGKGKGKGQSDV